jgi:DNA replication protein DnaC
MEFIDFGWLNFLETNDFRLRLQEWGDVDKGLDLMFLEDIGPEVDRFKTGEPTERLRELFNVMKNKWMVVTTNVPVADWEKRWDGRIMDRMLRNSVIVDMSGVPSYQKTKMEP